MDRIGAGRAGARAAVPPRHAAGQRVAAGARDARGARGSRARSTPNCAPSARRCKIEPPAPALVEKSERAKREQQIPLFHVGDGTGIPPLALLDDPKPQPKGYSEETLETAVAPDRVQAQGLRRRGAGGRRLSGPGDHALRDRAGDGREGQPDRHPGQGPRARLSVKSIRVVETIPGKSVHRPGDAQRAPRDDLPVRDPAARRTTTSRAQPADAGAGQGHRRPARWSPTWRGCRTCWWPAPPARASRSASTR